MQALQTEMQAQRGRVEEVLERAEAIAALRTPEVELVREGAGHVRQLWEVLQVEMERRTVMLDAVNHAQQYYTQAAKAESWLSGQKLQVLNEEKGNVCTALQSSFTQFSTETRAVGQKQMDSVNKMVNEMIDCSHSDAATIAEWKDGLNESWADLLELMETRAQMLAASYQLHKFFTDCQEVLVQIEGKMRQLPEVRSCQVSSANPGTLQRLLHSFEHSLQLLVSQVRQLQENAVQLRAIYAGEKADAILSREQEVMQAWKELLVACEGSRVQITTVTDKIQFFAVVRELNMWMDGIMGQIGSTNDARDLSVLDGMMSQHQNLKSKIDNKSKNFVHCVEMGKMLLAARNPAAEEVHTNSNTEPSMLQSNQPGSAEQSWLTIKEPITPNTREAGGGTDEVEELIRRHEAFRKAASTWKDHFSSLRQVIMETDLCINSQHQHSTARGEVYRPSSSLSAPVSRLDRPRARDRPKPRRRPRPKEPEEPRRSRSAPAQSVPSTPQPPAHTVQHEGFLYRKHEEEGKERSPNSKSWVNLFCVLKQGEIGFYKDSRHKTTPYNDEPLLNLAICEFDTTNGYKKKKNVFILRVCVCVCSVLQEDLKGWVNSINASLKEIEEIAKWEKATNSFTDPDKSERKERSEGAEPSEGAERSERSEKSERSDRSDKIEASDKSSEKRDTSEKERGDRAERGERGERGDRGSRGSSTSGKSK
uniref:Spectrin beta chain, non-erythrocytic 4-like n=1 Tax=Sinocyclocheilus grahami TaxID=75366 RepID=A0A672MY51_SINGR